MKMKEILSWLLMLILLLRIMQTLTMTKWNLKKRTLKKQKIDFKTSSTRRVIKLLPRMRSMLFLRVLLCKN